MESIFKKIIKSTGIFLVTSISIWAGSQTGKYLFREIKNNDYIKKNNLKHEFKAVLVGGILGGMLGLIVSYKIVNSEQILFYNLLNSNLNNKKTITNSSNSWLTFNVLKAKIENMHKKMKPCFEIISKTGLLKDIKTELPKLKAFYKNINLKKLFQKSGKVIKFVNSNDNQNAFKQSKNSDFFYVKTSNVKTDNISRTQTEIIANNEEWNKIGLKINTKEFDNDKDWVKKSLEIPKTM